MSEEPLYELAKDVSMPGGYWRAGNKKTEKQWREAFNMPADQPFSWSSEWFIDTTVKEEPPIDRVREIVDAEFTRLSLHSITYKEATISCVKKALIEFCKSETNEQNERGL